MGIEDRLSSMVERIQEHATVESVYGDPVETEGKTVIPVAKIAYGFGGGFGSSEDGDDEAAANEGGGMGGGVAAKPVGVVEITDDYTRFVRATDDRRLAVVALLALVVGYLLGKR